MAKRRQSGSEQIIIAQSVLLTAFALACYMASGSINDAWNALQDPGSMAAISTGDAILTDKTSVDLAATKSVVDNFNYVCAVALLVGITIGLATAVRAFRNK